MSNRSIIRSCHDTGRKTESKTLYFKSSRKRLHIKILREEEQQRCEIGVCILQTP